MKYLSLFSGIGGFELGIQKAYEDNKNRQQEPIREGTIGRSSEQSGDISDIGSGRREFDKEARNRLEQWICIGYSEIDKYAIQVYNKHFNHKNYGDATKIDTRQLPDFDLLVGGFPCQAFSIAGKRKGFDEARGTLFFDIARILADKKPRHFILENVKGLLSHDNGNTFTTIIRILSSMGYFVEWQVLNAKDFGVPQNRERVFIVGHLGGQPRRKVFPIGECNERIDGTDEETTQTNIARTVDARTGAYPKWGQYIKQLNNPTHSNNRVYAEDGEPSFTLTGQDIHGVAISNASKREFKWQEENSPCLQARDYKEPKLVREPTILRGRPRYENGKRELKMYEYDECPTVGTNVGQGDQKNMLKDGMRIRRLTPLECERLMAYPDNWTAEGTEGKISDTQRYKMCGNGIVSNVVEEVVRRLFADQII